MINSTETLEAYNDEVLFKWIAKCLGIKYPVREVVQAAGIKSTYIAEVNKGVNLAEYADPKPD